MNSPTTFQTSLDTQAQADTNFKTDIITSKEASAICTTIILSIISIVGIIGNGLVVWAFKKPVLEGVISCLLILLLACSDLIICTTVIPSTLYLDVWLAHTTDWVCRMHLALKGFIVPVSASLLVLIAVERFLLICFIPGIPLRRMQLITAIVFILIFGILLAIPMGLHVRATDRQKFKDELLNLDYMDNTFLDRIFKDRTKERDVSKRCHKDDTYISDDLYWYYQLFVSVLFVSLFATIAIIYLVIFIFVRRHESLMYEKYGSNKRRGCWVRIHADPTFSNSDRKRCLFKQTKIVPNFPESNQVPIKNSNSNVSGQNFELDSLHCACSCTGGNGFDETCNKNNSMYPTICPTNSASPQHYHHQHHGQQQQQQQQSATPQCHKTVSVGNSEFQWAIANMERKRKPHIRTAQTLALITATFIISYTPYLVSTIRPVDERLVKRVSEHPTWFDEVRSVLFYLYFVNSAINPLIYSCTNRHYQTRVRSLLKRFNWNRPTERCRTEMIPNESSHLNIVPNSSRGAEIGEISRELDSRHSNYKADRAEL